MARVGVKTRAGRIWAALLVFIFLSGAAFGQPVPGSDKIAPPGGYEALADKAGRTGSVRLIVKVDAPFRPMAHPESAESRRQMDHIARAQDAVLSALAAFNPRVVHRFGYVPYLSMEVDSPALQALLASPRVLDVHEDIPEFPTLDVSVPLIGAPSLWELYGPGQGFDGSSLTVAVLDTGVDKDHPFLPGGVVSEACYSTNSTADSAQSLCPGGATHSTAPGSAMPYASGVCPATRCDHGTHVAGIVAGRQGVAGSPGPGVAPGAGIIAIQVFSLIGGQVAAYQSDIMRGLERVYALRAQYNIASVNMSIGGSTQYPGYCDTDPRKPIIDSLKAAGIATVVSSGNNGGGGIGSCGTVSAPACISSAVSVGATDDSDAVALYSNSASFMSLLAPGTGINSSIPGGTYQNKSGTSMAAPHVAGAWALIKQAKPGGTVDQVLAAFTSTGPAVTDSAKCPSVTKSRISVSDALNTLGSGPSAETQAATVVAQTAATLNGRVNANNESTTVAFEYGTTEAYGSTVAAVPSPVSGSALTQVSQTISGLTQNTLYHFRVKAVNASGTSYGEDMTFTTVGACAGIADGGFEAGYPSPSWGEASINFGTPLCTVATCGGAGGRTGVWWAWFGGITGTTETASLTQDVVIPSGTSPRLEFYLWNDASSGNGADILRVMMDAQEIFSVPEGNPLYGGGYLLTGLDISAFADGAVHSLSFQSSTTGSGLTNFNLDDVSITCGSGTTLPVVATGAATSVAETGAVLNGTVNASGLETTVTFEYGTSTAYGAAVTAVPSPVAGGSTTAVSASLSGLLPGTTYHYRAVGSSSAGRAYGGDATFTTSCSPGSVKIGGTIFGSIQEAITWAADSDAALIQVKAGDFAEDLLCEGAGTITLKGGYDCAFIGNAGVSRVTGVSGTGGAITIGGTGGAVIENLVVR